MCRPASPGSSPSVCSPTTRAAAPPRPRRSRKETRQRRTDYVLRTLSHNVLSLRQLGSIEPIIRYLRGNRIGCASLQETWLEGHDTSVIDGFSVIRHNDEDAMRGGVAIVLDRDCTRAWDAAGNARCAPSARVLAVRLHFDHVSGGVRNQ